jgi:hypothetical protein
MDAVSKGGVLTPFAVSEWYQRCLTRVVEMEDRRQASWDEMVQGLAVRMASELTDGEALTILELTGRFGFGQSVDGSALNRHPDVFERSPESGHAGPRLWRLRAAA